MVGWWTRGALTSAHNWNLTLIQKESHLKEWAWKADYLHCHTERTGYKWVQNSARGKMRGKDIRDNKRSRSLKREDSVESKTRTGSRTHRGFKIHPPPQSHKQTTQTDQTDGLLIWERWKKNVVLEFRGSKGVHDDWCYGRCLPQSQRAVRKWKLQILGLHLIWNMTLLGNPPTLTGGAGAELRGLPITVLARLRLIFTF